jgi:pimeloyl-ACP methyl ester carboxylesterase
MEDFVQDVHHFTTEHFKDVPDLAAKLIVIGWSLGGMITMNMAANWPGLYKKIFLVSSGMISGFAQKKELV